MATAQTSRRKKPAVVGVRRSAPLHTELGIGARTGIAVRALGSKSNLARLLDVSPSQPTRWITGEELPSPQNLRSIVDLEHVITRASLLWADDKIVSSWLKGRNAFLGGARPVDVLVTEGSARVIEALDQEMSGAFA